MSAHDLRIVSEQQAAEQRVIDEANDFIVSSDDSMIVGALADLIDEHPHLFAIRFLHVEREVEQLHELLRVSPRASAQARAIAAIQAITDVGERVAQAHARVIQLEDERPLVKAKCIEEMIGTPNPITGKPHSATSAEAIVEKHQEFWTLRRRQESAEVEKHRAEAMYQAALRMADLEVEAYRAARGGE